MFQFYELKGQFSSSQVYNPFSFVFFFFFGLLKFCRALLSLFFLCTVGSFIYGRELGMFTLIKCSVSFNSWLCSDCFFLFYFFFFVFTRNPQKSIGNFFPFIFIFYVFFFLFSYYNLEPNIVTCRNQESDTLLKQLNIDLRYRTFMVLKKTKRKRRQRSLVGTVHYTKDQ